jgi:hypothetical protein
LADMPAVEAVTGVWGCTWCVVCQDLWLLLTQPALLLWLFCLQVIQLKPQKPLQQLEPAQQQQQDGNEPVAMDTCTPTASSSGAAAAEAAVAAAAAATGSSDGGGPDAMQQDTPRPQGPSEAAAGAAAAAAGHSGVVPMDASSSSGARGGLYNQLQQQLSAGGGQPVLEYTLKFETQMYKLRDDEYSFDIQVGRGCVWDLLACRPQQSGEVVSWAMLCTGSAHYKPVATVPLLTGLLAVLTAYWFMVC